ncbi:MAG: hypothetical protein HYX69_09105 [Planctomycetia bacterium]|nr:hypothetical protein [Planctomycetia bacterium]
MQTASPKPARWYQFSLRTMLVLLALVAVGCVATKYALPRLDEQRRRARARVQRVQTLEMWDVPSISVKMDETKMDEVPPR